MYFESTPFGICYYNKGIREKNALKYFKNANNNFDGIFTEPISIV